MTRVLTALIGIPILLYAVLIAPPIAYVVLVVVCALLSLHEYFGLTEDAGFRTRWPAYVIASVLLFSFYPPSAQLRIYWPAGAILVLIAAWISRTDLTKALNSTATTLFGAWYVGGLAAFLVGVRMIDPGTRMGAYLTILLLAITWTGDSFAFFVGKAIGRHPLSAISPKKTVEGAIGGLVFSIVAAIVCRSLFLQELTWRDTVLMSAVVAVFGQIGDLCESLLKRSVSVKDSGSIVPGHGGMLDRLDSLLFAAPAMYYYVYFILYKS